MSDDSSTVPVSDDSSTLWHGRFEGGPSEALMAYTTSLPFDRQLWRDDVAGSRAHVRGLWRAGLLDDGERDAILDALDGVEGELASDVFHFASGDEDIHTAVERRVTELAGDAGAKLHTARSRNDQVATDLRLWCKRELPSVAGDIDAL
ncbi:MAG: argininosuccinate lyase, partial [Acidimicrobiia bacterium]|nr:argininosuccinate lyase [Acidimicrobiia bacterium]